MILRFMQTLYTFSSVCFNDIGVYTVKYHIVIVMWCVCKYSLVTHTYHEVFLGIQGIMWNKGFSTSSYHLHVDRKFSIYMVFRSKCTDNSQYACTRETNF